MYLASAWLLPRQDFSYLYWTLRKTIFHSFNVLHNMLIKDYSSSVTTLLHSTNHHLKLNFTLPFPSFSSQTHHSISVKYSEVLMDAILDSLYTY